MRKLLSALLILGLFTSIAPVEADGGSLHRLWEINLAAEIIPAANKEIQPGIFALRFSPDGSKIALAGNTYQQNPPKSRLIVVDVEKHKAVQHFEIADIASDSEVLGIRPPALAWSQDGDFILAGFNLVHLVKGSICQIPPTFAEGFLSAIRLVGRTSSKAGLRQLEFFDLQCKSQGTWEVGFPEWALSDVSPDRGLVSLLRKDRAGPHPFTELMVVDPITRKIVHEWPTNETGQMARFAARGTVLCAGDNGEDLYEDRKAPPRCMDVDSGEQISAAPKIYGGAPFSASEQATRVVASDHSHIWNIFYREYDTALKNRVLWDFAENTIITSWPPEKQFYGPASSKLDKKPFSVAISPDGHFIAEGGGSILRLYRIEP